MLDVEVRVNGEVWGSGSTRGMRHSLADVIAYASAGDRLAAGPVIGLGTVPGCSGIEAGRWLSPGDVVELAPNRVLDQVERWELPGGARPEDVVFDPDGRLYAGVEDGRIWRWPAGFPDAGEAGLFADTHGRPLGLEVDPRDGTLIVCDAYRGLLRVDETGRVRVLADRLPLSPGRRRPGACRRRPLLPERDGTRPGRVVPAGRSDRKLQPAAQRYGLVARLAADGQVTQSLHGPAGSFREIVGVRQHDGWLYLRSLYETAVGRVPVPAQPAPSQPAG